MTDVVRQNNERPRGPRTGQKPGWMSIPGGPKEPVWADFTAAVQKLNAEKSKLFDRIKELNGLIGSRDDNNPAAQERRELQARLNEIRDKRQSERDISKQTKDEMQQVRNEKAKVESQLRALTAELGMFQSLEEINMAINHIMYRMETGSAGIKSEKKTHDRLLKLERAKTLLTNLQPLQEAIEEHDNREYELQQEFRDISERMKQLSQEMDTVMDERKDHDAKHKKTAEERQKLFDERRAVSDKISTISSQINELRAQFDKDRKAWDDWKVVAQQKYTEKIEAEREERQRKYRERQQALRNERKKDKIAKRRNPFVKEIEVCSTLIHYLKDKEVMYKKSEEERKRRKEAEAFNPTADAPQGTILLKPKFDEICLGTKKSKSKKEKEKAKAKEAAAAAAPVVTKETNEPVRAIQHSHEKLRFFDIVGVSAPSSIAEFQIAIASLQAKQKEYESHIKTGDIEVSSSEDEAEAEEETPVVNAE